MEIATIKNRLSIESILSHNGLTADRNDMLPCPFHDEKPPSMQLYATTVYCFSTNCARHGKSIDVIDFIMYKEGCTKHEAIMKAKELIGHVTETPAEPLAVGETAYSRLTDPLIPELCPPVDNSRKNGLQR